MINRIIYKLLEKTYSVDNDDFVSIFADPRSGSTWLAESLKSIPHRIVIDEPLHLTFLSKYGIDNFHWRQHVPEHEEYELLEKYFRDLVRGQHMSAGLIRLNKLKEIRNATGSILKVIRGKLLLPWFIENLKPKLKPIFLIRNPYAAISSAISHPSWNYEFKEFVLPTGLYSRIYLDHLDIINSIKYKEEELAFHWCLGNSYCLNHEGSGRSWVNIKYEDLLLNKEKVYDKIQSEMSLEIPREAFFKKLLLPSSTRLGSEKISNLNQISQYKNILSEEQTKRIARILAYFAIEYEDIKFNYQ